MAYHRSSRLQPKQLPRHLRDLAQQLAVSEQLHPIQVAGTGCRRTLLPSAARCRLAMPIVGCSCTGPFLSNGPVSSRAAKSVPIPTYLQWHEPCKSHRHQRCQHRHGAVTMSSMHASDRSAHSNGSSRPHSDCWQPVPELHASTLSGASLAIALPALWSLGGGGNLGGTGGSGGRGGGSGGSGSGESSLWSNLHCCNACSPPAHCWHDIAKLHVSAW